MKADCYESDVYQINQEHLNLFAEASSGTGKIHTDPEYASTTPFEKPLVHGLFLQAFIEQELSNQFEQWNQSGDLELTFLKPVKVNETFQIRLEKTVSKEEVEVSILREEERVVVGKANVMR
ncbi:hypothetical protein GCM10009865_32200 [Aeromicrobium ponti]|uniref:MaoC dehydratase-like protein n=1 Tax=Cytobacillus oceanisediminis TaxID=665099 RepID=A0A562JRF6_9BACI|nr:MaoC/PaaZ C-terminal domain-containing protein [Cytobacillus oceanisediminis]TWH85718.1 MaoC dehydratase-like protein [Cytobacillus oceanisediminis]